MAAMACAGLMFVRFVRNMEGSKHLLRVSVKWLLRLSGTVFVWKSTASPMLSLSALGLLLFLYAVHAITKRPTDSIKKGKKEN